MTSSAPDSTQQTRDSLREQNRRRMRRWTDRVVRVYTASALQIAGFSSSAVALSALPELTDDESMNEARRRVDAALETVLFAGEIPRAEDALVATFAARSALAAAAAQDPSTARLKTVVDAMHAGADVAVR